MFILSLCDLRAQSFLDSIRSDFGTSVNQELASISETFSLAWPNLPLNLQTQIKNQTKILKSRDINFFPYMTNYFATIGFAFQNAKSDISKLSSFLKMNDKVILYEDEKRLDQYFRFTRLFFERHALNFDKAFNLQVADDSYNFEYAEDTPPLEDSNFEQKETENEAETQSKPAWLLASAQPVILGPVIKFDKATFNFITSNDTVSLKKTSGVFSLTDGFFVGKNGTFDWESAGLDKDTVFYEFGEYNFNVKTPYLKSEQGKLTYLGKFNKKIDGVFEYANDNHSSKQSAIYPRFTSFSNDLEINTIEPKDLKFKGGFSLVGGKSSNQSIFGGASVFKVFHEDTIRFIAQSNSFEFSDSTIVSPRAKLTIFQGSDSIFHPSVYINYNISKKELFIQQEKGPLRNTSYSSSYFKVDFNAERILWDLNSGIMRLWVDGGSSQSPMVIESVDYFNDDDYYLLFGKGFTFNPLAVVVLYAKRHNVDKFYVDDLIAETGGNANEIRQAINFLFQKGMVNFDSNNGLVEVKKQAFNFYYSKAGKIDFDNLKIHSTMNNQRENGSIDFNKNEFKLYGVERVNISDSLHVDISPDTTGLVLRKNREIFFNGTVNAKNLEISGKEFLFKYDSFFVKLKKIDSIRFFVTETDSKGRTTRKKVNNSLVGADSLIAAEAGLPYDKENVNMLYLNIPSNRSGKVLVESYPKMDAKAGAVVYFDSKDILKGVYKKSVYFAVPHFKLDSLNDADLRLLHFDGTFVSGGIFPKFKEDLHSMPDNSLGFNHKFPDQGYSLYGTKGKGFGTLGLNKSGLRLNGKIEYLSATLESPNFIFYPDSVVGKGNVGELKAMQLENVWFPQVSISKFALNWTPTNDKFRISTLDQPFSLCDNTSKFKGSLVVSRNGMSGSGKIDLLESEILSQNFSFFKTSIVGSHSNFKLSFGGSNSPALSGNDVLVTHKLAQKLVTIAPEVEGVASIEFPAALFKTSIPQAVWDLQSKKITMSKGKDFPLEKSYFYSTRKDLDSLVFNGEKGEYDIEKKELKVSGIPYIIVGDARITPENNEVLILENSIIGHLKNTKIVLDTLNGYHTLTNGEIDIISRKSFSGFATYQYVNAVNDTFSIKMSNFRVEPVVNLDSKKNSEPVRMQTVATGEILEKSKLFIAPHIFYKGDLIMYATLPGLQLDGFIKLDLKKNPKYDTWLKYVQSGNEKDIYLNFDLAMTESGEKPKAGFFFSEKNDIYFTFASDKESIEDEQFFLPSGSLYYKKENDVFAIENRKKVAGEILSGKVLTYNEEKQEVKFEGTVNFFRGNKLLSLTSSVIGEANLERKEFNLNSFIMVDLNLPTKALYTMSTDLQKKVHDEGLPEGLGDATDLLYKMANIVGEKEAQNYEQRSLQNYFPLKNIPALVKSLVFADVRLRWSEKYKSFYSTGALGLSHILSYDINAEVEGYMEIKKNDDGSPVFNVFIKATPQSWYYFSFEDNVLLASSSNEDFNSAIGSSAKIAQSGGVGSATLEETLNYVNNFRKKYMNIEAPYDLESSVGINGSKRKKSKDEDDGF